MKKAYLAFIIALLLGLLVAATVCAQDEELKFSISRDFGYSGGKDIQGLFSMKVTGSEDVVRVDFYIDETVIYEDTEPPFKVQFSTDDYPLGEHSLYAVGYTSDGRELKSVVVHTNFVPAEEGWKAAGKIAIPLFAVIFGGILLAALVPIITGRRTVSLAAGTPRNYPLGGGICKKCGRPFAFHIYGLNILMNKLDRCPYCGKWSAVRVLPLDKLRAAEQTELEQAGTGEGVAGESPEEKLKKELDDSKYQGL